MGQKTVFDLEGVDVFAAADDQVFDAAGYGYVAVGGEGGFVACLFLLLDSWFQPGFSFSYMCLSKGDLRASTLSHCHPES